MQVYMRKIECSLKPVSFADEEILAKIKPGEIVSVDFKKPRNVRFHRKFFALLDFAFEHWEPEQVEFKGVKVGKNLDVFRGWVTCQAGYYYLAITPDGKVKANPQSISFSKMDEEKFRDLYNKVLDVLLRHVFKQYKNREELESVVDQIMGFA